MSRYCKDMRRIIKRPTRQDDNDNHHRRTGEEVIKKEDIKEQEPNDKKTRQTSSTRTSSIIDHIACYISHGSRASSTCLCGIDDITSSILDYLDSSRSSSSNGQQQFINIKQQQRQIEDINIKQNFMSNIKDFQHMHIKIPQQDDIKHMVGDNIIDNNNISLNHARPDIIDIVSTSSGLITHDEADIKSNDINMLAVSQPRLPTPTPFDGTSPPFQEWASELRTFLDINGFQYIAQMDIAFRDAPIHLSHLCAGTEIGTTSQDGITQDKAAIKLLQDELADPGHLRADDVINAEITVLEEDIVAHQSNFDDELAKVKKASDYLSYILVHSTKTASEPNHYIRRLHQQENGFKSWRLLRLRYSGGHRLGTYSLLQNILAPKWSEQHQHHQFRTWMEEVARYESESGMVIDDHLKIATVMNHLRGSIREHLLINSKPLTPWEDIRLLIDNFFSNSYIQQASRPGNINNVQQDDINFIKKKGKGKSKGKG